MSRITRALAKVKLNAGKRSFTRAKALKTINLENCQEERFVKHSNKNVRRRAEHLLGKKNAADVPAVDVE